MQRRWLHGFVFGLGFMACFVTAIACMVNLMRQVYGMWDSNMSEDQMTGHARKMVAFIIISAVVAFVLYIANIVDAWRATRRMK